MGNTCKHDDCNNLAAKNRSECNACRKKLEKERHFEKIRKLEEEVAQLKLDKDALQTEHNALALSYKDLLEKYLRLEVKDNESVSRQEASPKVSRPAVSKPQFCLKCKKRVYKGRGAYPKDYCICDPSLPTKDMRA